MTRTGGWGRRKRQAGGDKQGDKHLDGIGRWWQPSRRKPPGRHGLAASAHGERRRSGLPGPPGDINTARHATDTWPGVPPGNAAGSRTPPATGEAEPPGRRRQATAGDGDTSG